VRLGDADRERLIDQLKAHAVAGRLSTDELERRVGVVAASETHEDVAEVLGDLPPLPGMARRPRRHGETAAPEPDWQPTSERFRDPRSGRVTRVWVDAGGGRHYVPEG
jgi:Domain of unknown function (DUF1707)